MLKLAGVFLLLIGCASADDDETLRYEVLSQDKKIEVRQYSSYIAASVTFSTKEEFDDQGFKVLADYIFGNNIQQVDINMTSPVITEGEDIGMTSPVMTGPRKEGWTMTFTMPQRYTMDTLPMPVDERIVITEVPAQRVAAIRFSGYRTDRKNARKEKELRAWLKEKGFTKLGGASFAGYNPPWTPPMFRRNEVMIPILD